MEHSFWFILICLVFVGGEGREVSPLSIEELKVLSSYDRVIEMIEVKGCLLHEKDSKICDDDRDSKDIVPSGTLCVASYNGIISNKGEICNEGVWEEISSNYEKHHSREKRFHRVCRTSRRRRWTRRRRSRTSCTKPNHAPICKSTSKTVTTPSKATSVNVTWSPPDAYDIENGVLSATHVSGVRSGDLLQGSALGLTHVAYYEAVDSVGSRASCNVKITVQVITCSILTPPTHGYVTCSHGNIYGQECQFECDAGFSPTKTKTTCLENGKWSVEGNSVCQGVTCPLVPPTIPNGYYDCSDNSYGSTCDPVCDPAYSAPFKYPITCSINGEWEGIPTDDPVCKDSDPPTLLGCPNNVIETADIGQTSAVVNWLIPTAIDIQDSVPPKVYQTFGSISPGSFIENGLSYVVKYQAFDLAGNPSVECRFTVEVIVIQCDPLNAPEYGHYSCDLDLIYGSQCTYMCEPGYSLQGTQTLTCGQFGSWSSSLPSCTVLTCNPPELDGIVVENGYFDCVSPIIYQTSCQVKCNDGFVLKQYVTAMCSVDDNNNPFFDISSLPECSDNEPPTFQSCGVNNVISFDAIKGTHSAKVHYTTPVAVDNYDTMPTVTKINGPEIDDMIHADKLTTLEFQAMDAAGNPSNLCIYTLQVNVIECPVYIPPSHGSIVCSEDNIYGSVCTLSCKEGYRVKDIDQTECLQDGTWSVTNLECTETACLGPPVPPENGIYHCTDPNYTFNSICQVQCNDGFTLFPQFTFTRCAANQTWEIFNNPECRDTSPPYFLNCLNELTVYADKGLRSTIVYWSLPEALDNVDSVPIVTQLAGPIIGSEIEGEVTVKYQALDSASNPSEICTLEIIVEVIKCPSPGWSDYVDIVCDLETIYGSTCNYTCQEGFEVSTPSSTECLQTGFWSYGIKPPTCSKITCDAPPNTANGEFTCFDVSYEYESICILTCEPGFSSGYTVFATCEADGQWFVSSSNQCEDVVPPVIYNCITYQTFRTDFGKSTATRTWQIPTATDNVDSPENITILQVSGPPIGSEISVGTVTVEYTAIDSANNQPVRSCSISVVIEEVVCTDPKYFFDDNNLEYSCPSFIWGENCTLSCPAASSYILVGPDVITCEETYWSYIGNDEPTCQAAVCPPLEPPLNGVLLYETANTQPVVIVQCNGAFDLEYNFNGQILCYSSGEWSDSVPDCINKNHPSFSLMEAEYYYEGDCNDPVLQEELNAKVAIILEDFIGTGYQVDCVVDDTCGVDSFTVDCGPSSRRKRRDIKNHSIQKKQVAETRVVIVLYKDASVTSFSDFLANDAELISLYDVMYESFNNNTFDIPGYPTVPNSMTRDEYSSFKCELPGTIQVGFLCKGCSRGSYLSEFDGCVKCPIGTYMDHDAALECIQCPNGTSTIHNGTKSLEQCLEYCPVGFVSQSGLKPCAPCQAGLYQDSLGQQSCLQCATGQTTFAAGQEHCTDYDVVFNGAAVEDIYTTPTDTNVMSIMFWILKDCGTQVKFSLTNSEHIVALDIGALISVNENSVYDFTPHCTKWTHVSLVMMNTGWSLYVNGTSLASLTETLFTTIPNNTQIILQYNSVDAELRMNSLGIFTNELTTSDISAYQASCINDYTDAILTSDDIIHKYIGIETDQSTCIAIDSCKDDPCGDHICTPTTTGYNCICLNGYTGTNCEIAPDNCIQNECQNDATCISNTNNYTCVCLPGYKGKFCQIHPVNGDWGTWSTWSLCSAQCDSGVRNRTRQCDNPSPGQYGNPCNGLDIEEEICNTMFCETAFPCSINPCGDHVCVETRTGYQCICNAGYTGLQCDSLLDKCDPNPCYNNATCNIINNDVQCTCEDGFEGTYCETVTDAIRYWSEWSVCNVTCGGGISNRTLLCPANVICDNLYEEKVCNDESCKVDHCDPNPCVNGQCISSANNFTCICPQTFKGVLCDEPVNYCDVNPCKHGQCIFTESNFTCDCSNTGFTGLYCSQPAAIANWSPWSEWSSCSVSCDTGVRNRTRLCNNPSPPPGGEMCVGENMQSIQCNVECNEFCSTNPCGVDHMCKTKGDSYLCVCQNGYSGSNCEIPPDPCRNKPCQNNGECIQNNDKPSCNCVNGYTGKTCGIPPDGSSWSPWSDWTDCSTSCGTGSRSRTRECKVGSLGQDCNGDNLDTGSCRIMTCSFCPRFLENPGMKKDCNYTGETKHCTVRCKNGYFPPKEVIGQWNTTYYCGPSNGYEWIASDPLDACTKGILPKDLSTSISLEVTPSVPCSKSKNIMNSLYDNIYNLTCLSKIECDMSLSMPQCGSRVKRSTDSFIEVYLVFNMSTLKTSNGSVDVWGAVNDSLQPFIYGIDDWSSITVDDITYVIDPNDYINTTEVIECPSGFFLQDYYGVCAGCPSGTMYELDSKRCVYCPIGFYQENSGQISCDSCTDGYTTLKTGSKNRDECIELAKDEINNITGLIVGTVVGVICLILAVIVGCILYNKKKRNTRQIFVENTPSYYNWSSGIGRETRPASAASISNVKVSI